MKQIPVFLALAIFLVGVLGSTTKSQAQFKPTIAYQGFLSDDTGTPVTEPSAVLQFALRDRQDGGAILWQERHDSVPIVEGIFTVELGKFSPLDSVSFNQNLFLQVTVGDAAQAVTLSPAIPMAEVGYSLQAGSLDDDALIAGENVRIDKVGGSLRISAEGGGAVSANSLSASDGTPNPALFVNGQGDVGIGDSPTDAISPLHVKADDIGIDKKTFVEPPSLTIEADDASSLGLVSGTGGDLGSAFLMAQATGNQLVDLWSISREPAPGSGKSKLHIAYGSSSKFTSNESMLVLTTFGFLGLGTDDPGALLHLQDEGDAELIVEADADKQDTKNNPAIRLKQKGNSVNAFIALEGPSGGRSSGTLEDALIIGSEDDESAIQFVTDDQVRMTIGTDGSIRQQPVTSFLTVSSIDMLPEFDFEGGGNEYQRSPLKLTVGEAACPGFPFGSGISSDQSWYGAVHLPHGATVTKATAVFDIRSSEGQLTVRLIRDPGLFDPRQEMAVLDSDKPSGNAGDKVVDSTINVATIDNENFFYYVEVTWPKGSCGSLGFSKVILEYTTTRIG